MTAWSVGLDVVAAVLVLAGAALTLAAAVGLLRFPDVLSRMHATTKPQTLGMILVMSGAAIRLRGSVDVWMLLLVGMFQLATAPVSAHLVGRVAYRTRHVRRDLLLSDDLVDSSPSGQDGDDATRDRPGADPAAPVRPAGPA